MNPFRETIVSDPWRDAAADVPEIQASVFHECLQGIEQVRRSNRSASLLIHGGAGAGKTHLLSRLRSRVMLTAPTATDRDECLFVWIRLQTSPRMIWRHVRRTLVEDWFRPIRGQNSQFNRILFRRLAEIRVAEGDLEPWYEYMLENHPEGLDELLDRIADDLYLDRNTTVAFKHLAFSRHIRDLRAWLGGDSLPDEALTRLDLTQEDGNDEEQEHTARKVVLMLCRLAGKELPIVLSLDQVEALQTNSTDREGLFAFGQLVSTLHDETSNVLIVACVQSAFVMELKDKSRGADYDRMTSLGARSLSTLTRAEAEKLIASRLAMADPSPPIPTNVDRLWPLEQADFHRLVAVDELTPRRLLATCAERFETWLANAANSSSNNALSSINQPTTSAIESPRSEKTSQSIDDFLKREWDARSERCFQENSPERTEEIVRHGIPELVTLLAPQWKLTNDKLLPDVHLILDGPTGEIGISVCTQPNMRTAGVQLKRLKDQFARKRLTRLIIIQDERRAITKTAKVAQQSLEELLSDGAIVEIPSKETLANLDALRELLSDTKSGDLAVNGENVTPSKVDEWLTQNLPSTLRAFFDQLTKLSR